MREKVSKYFARAAAVKGGTRKRARRPAAAAAAAAVTATVVAPAAAAVPSASESKRKKRKTRGKGSPTRVVPRTRPTTKGLQLIAPHDPSTTHTLILGSYPSINSFETGDKGEPFGFRNNAFWWIVGDCLGFKRLPTVPGKGGNYEAPAGIREHLRYGDNDLLAFDGACAKLTGAGFALWDVIGSTAAERPDSMDSTIVDARLNPIREVLLRHRNISKICFTGTSTATLFCGKSQRFFAGRRKALLKSASGPRRARALEDLASLEQHHMEHRAFLASGIFAISDDEITQKCKQLRALVEEKGAGGKAGKGSKAGKEAPSKAGKAGKLGKAKAHVKAEHEHQRKPGVPSSWASGRIVTLCALQSPSPANAGVSYEKKRENYEEQVYSRANVQ